LAEERDRVALSGVDVSAEALRRAGERWPGAELHQLDIQQSALERQWDLVLCSLVLEHLPDDVGALRNMRRMTGGHLLAATIAGDFERHRSWERQMGHVRNYARGELEDKLERAGFTVERTVYWGFPFYSPIARRLHNSMRSEPEYTTASRLAARAMYLLYWLNSSRRGDLLIALARA
jgi:trans-aconitate methyltransferase